MYASNFNRFGKMYRVMVQADPALRTNLESPENRVNIISDPVSVSPKGAYLTRIMSFREEKIPSTDQRHE